MLERYISDILLIPQVFRQRIIRHLHKGHQEAERMKSRARSYVNWPHIDSDIMQFSKQCQNCATAANYPKKSMLYSWPIPENVLD